MVNHSSREIKKEKYEYIEKLVRYKNIARKVLLDFDESPATETEFSRIYRELSNNEIDSLFFIFGGLTRDDMFDILCKVWNVERNLSNDVIDNEQEHFEFKNS